MQELLGLTQTLWRLGDAVSHLLLLAAAVAAGAGLVISPHLRGVAFATAVGLAVLHLLQ